MVFLVSVVVLLQRGVFVPLPCDFHTPFLVAVGVLVEVQKLSMRLGHEAVCLTSILCAGARWQLLV